MVHALVALLSLMYGAMWWYISGPVFGVVGFLFIWLCFFVGRISAGWNPFSGDN